ncbi:5-histidylcysteine sulfoxide synthase [Methylophaga sp.]|uniref:5-histidylcysteine sulfoxide synthase n=1 Tax=Methylophaga sp. TaxID=2024840 RepID=UPI0014005EA1|nr:5-histidylcysteine sulfoxide synthase [Methylophaga sp.]MTI63281.1 5-histidylcysteine sulfoxide synthase [Methylophaga sp.]
MTAESTLKKSAITEQHFLRTPLLNGDDPAAKRREIANYFNFTFERYESLFDTLRSDEAFYRKSIPLRHPLIFYYGHTATFFVNKMLLAGLIDKRINPRFESMFAVGVDEMSWDDLNDEHYQWPAVEEVTAYRQQVKAMINRVILKAPLKLPIDWENPWWAIVMGIEHEQIHLETSSVLIRQQQLDLVQPRSQWRPFKDKGKAPKNSLVDIPAGTVRIGKDDSDSIYGWDNEYGQHQAKIEAFQASRFLVSNQEFLEFVDAGGYQEYAWWEEEGLAWRQFTQAQYPTFWIQNQNGWQLRLMTEVVDMPWNWPVDVNYHEAKAFCNWKAKQTGQPVRLPTEDEWYRIYDHSGLSELDDKPAVANIHLDYAASSCPVDQFAHGELYDVIGNVWQWTETPTYPFDGFKVHPIYDDFTTPTFDGQHNLIKGGSWISCGNESRLASRYAFRRHFFQHAGFRYVVSDNEVEQHSSNYETDQMLSQYAEFHYGESYFNVPNFPKTLAEIAVSVMGEQPKGHALDIGCAVGRASFELARHFDKVTGIDFSARLINLGVQMAQKGVVRYTITDEGDLVHYEERRLEQLGLADVADKVEFMQGDACNLKSLYRGYDLILAANLIDRLYRPAQFLRSVHERLNEGGILMLASPYTWLEAHTEKDEWLGGFKKDGESFTTLDGLKAILEPHFELIRGPESVPFVIRETSRKFQHTLSEVTVWKLRQDAHKPDTS